ncbi:MAG: transcriptional regulator NrdR [Eubacteriales bacterium]|jgi:transcriptional repressor NrdR
MKCPYCGNPDTSVVDSRPADDNTAIRRRRVCSRCGRRFTSYERIETIPLMVIKKDHNREAFDRSKIEAGIVRACHKRPIPAQKIHDMVDQIENEIYNKGEREIASSEIGEIVMKYMKDLDQVAYVRFASVYREFKDAETFMDELKKLLK